MKFYVIAGEASGDLHGSNLIAALKKQSPKVQFRAWGGDKIQSQGATLVKHYKELAFMGFLEVVTNLRKILSNISMCKKDIETFKPDAIILIDYPGFNLRIAKWAKDKNIRVIYYISPQIWAWNTSRVHKIKKIVDQMICIIPFEQAFYASYGMETFYAGHPLMEVYKKFIPDPNFRKNNQLTEDPILLLMPGSRKQEITKMLPIMLEASLAFPSHQIAIAALRVIGSDFYQQFITTENVNLIYENNYQLLHVCDLSWISSGTASLEAAIFGVPHVVCYKGSSISYQIAKRLVKVKYISLVNLISNQPIVPELIQKNLTITKLCSATEDITRTSSKIKESYKKHVVSQLGDGTTSAVIAREILSQL